jgi:transposase
MEPKDVFTLGLGLSAPWKLVGQRLDIEKRPNELHLEVVADRGALFPCPECDGACKAHDFASFTWQHLNFFQHHCFITARVPRIDCPDHGVKRAPVPWARPGSRFTLLFEQAALIGVARDAGAGGFALHRHHRQAAVAHRRALCPARRRRARSGRGRALSASMKRPPSAATTTSPCSSTWTAATSRSSSSPPARARPAWPRSAPSCSATAGRAGHSRRGRLRHVARLPRPSLAQGFPNAAVTVDWFHVVQLFTTALDQVRKTEARSRKLPKATRWAVLKAGERTLTGDQRIALAELETGGFATAAAYRAKEMLRWIRQADGPQAARWRITRFINHIGLGLDPAPLLDPVRRALRTFATHVERIIERWTSSHSNARLEALNGLFQAARSRARGYRNTATFVIIIYLLGAPLPDILKST